MAEQGIPKGGRPSRTAIRSCLGCRQFKACPKVLKRSYKGRNRKWYLCSRECRDRVRALVASGRL